ncbi:uncharacterized protein LOC116853753 [Odontomachus brunneus]|uniref:uncharacterized protein LOC116853753 n=1 Tax=Odontomachus brunneus TaxID=486640 RepID=UPI0013F2ACA6|nr:uncharacterized protein LOC116853753 [Odontomachus brunneus]
MNQKILSAHLRKVQTCDENYEEKEVQQSNRGRQKHEESVDQNCYVKFQNCLKELQCCKQDLQECREKLENCKADRDICQQHFEESLDKEMQWSAKYISLKESKAFPLTEATGQQILDILLEKKQTKERTLSPDNNVNEVMALDITISTGNNNDKSVISKVAYDEIMREKDNGKVLNGLSYAVWGIDVLSNRVVRSAVNTPYKELTPTKKAAVVKLYARWMREVRKLPEHIINEELERKKLNERFNKAITGARKKVQKVEEKKGVLQASTSKSKNNSPKKSLLEESTEIDSDN